MSRTTHAGAFRMRLAAGLAALYAALVLLVTLWPTTVDRGLDPDIERILHALHRRGLPGFVDYALVEFSANVLFFVPVGFLVALLITRRLQWVAVLVGAVLSGCVETAQALFLPGRVASLGDVAANTLGAAFGCLLAVGVRRVILHRDRLVLQDLRERLAGTGADAAVGADEVAASDAGTAPSRRPAALPGSGSVLARPGTVREGRDDRD